MGARRWAGFAAMALAGHALALAVLPRDRPAARPPSDDAVSEIDLLPPPAETAPSPSPAPESTPAPAPTLASASARTPAPASARETATATEPGTATGAVAGPPAASAGDGAWTFNPGAPGDVTSRRAIASAARGIGTEGLAEQNAPSVGGIAEALDARDAALGVGRGGPVLAALERAAAGSSAPFEGVATFDVGVDTGGHVSVALLDASVAASEWARVATAAGASLDPAAVRIPPGARGWHVIARVEARLAYPNGMDPKKLGDKVQASPGHLPDTRNPGPPDRPPIEAPSVTLSHTGKVCSVGITLGLIPGITGGCDPSNIGAQAIRTVHGRIVSEGRL